MISMRRGLFVAALAVTLAAPVTFAGEAEEAERDVLLQAIRANRKALIAANLDLSDEEAKKFWPVYDAYDREMGELQRRIAGVIEDYSKSFSDMSDEKALELTERYLAIETDRARLRQSKLEALVAVLPGKKVGRFYQIENKMDAVIRYDVAASIPVVE